MEPSSFELNAGEAYRLRLINASNARILQINPKAIGAEVLGYDGFVFDQPTAPESEYVPLTPAQRIDLLIKGDASKTIVMNDVGDFALQELSGEQALSLAKFRFIEATSLSASPEIKLTPNVIAEPELSVAKRFDLVMTGGTMGRMGEVTYNGKPLERGDFQRTKQVWAFNGVANLPADPLFAVKKGETVIVKIVNQTGWAHGMHVHGHHFQILTVNGKIRPGKPWRDTFLIDRDETVEIAFVADNPGKWLLHCHMLEHAAAGMNTWFFVN